MNTDQDSVISKLREEWDFLSRKNAFHYIASLKNDWSLDEFLLSGESDVVEVVDPFLSQSHFATRDKKMLEIGCGVGRMTFAFAKRFAEVQAVDISGEMIGRAEELKKRLGVMNAHFRLCDGNNLRDFPNSSIDFCFSYIVFQHIPDVPIILNYIREIGRVLKKDGLFRFQVNGYRKITFPRGYCLMWGTSRTHRLRKWKILTRPHFRFGKAHGWKGVPVSISEIHQTCKASGLICTCITGVGTQFMWVEGRKAP